ALRHGDRELQVGARLVSFAAPATQRYRFRLDGFDEDWIDAGALGERVYSHLPPGRYRLQVDAVDAWGQRPGQPAELAIEVAPPWWRTPLALALWVLLVLAAVAGAGWAQRRRLAAR